MRRILVVDDDNELDLYQAFLAGDGVELILVEACSAVCAVRQAQPPFDVAIISFDLKGAPSGAQLVSILHGDFPNLPIVVVSATLDPARATRAKALGALDFLLKPLERNRLRNAVNVAFGAQPPPLLEKLQARLIGESRALGLTLDRLARIIPFDNEPVLLIGENGTGKELLARAVHELGVQSSSPFVPVNVAAIPQELVESQLFGHEPGAFTGALTQHKGYFEITGSGVLFLDEIGEISQSLQVKLLRVIQERTFHRICGTEKLQFDGRLVCATNRELATEVRNLKFRQDLYFRINAHEVKCPPLREREKDLWILAKYFLDKHGGRRRIRLGREAGELLRIYSFPGNVRELDNIIKDALSTCKSEEIGPYDLPLERMFPTSEARADDQMQQDLTWPAHFFEISEKNAVEQLAQAFLRKYLPRKLKEARGNVTQAAQLAGFDRKTFYAKWQKAGLGPVPELE